MKYAINNSSTGQIFRQLIRECARVEGVGHGTLSCGTSVSICFYWVYGRDGEVFALKYA